MSDLKVNVLKTVNKATKKMVERKNQTWPTRMYCYFASA